jgi:hypothetical protein
LRYLRVQYTIDAHSSDISKILKALCKNGYLVASGIGRGTHYKLNAAYASTHANAPVNAPVNAKGDAKPNAKPIEGKFKVNDLTDNNVTLAFDSAYKPTNAPVNATPNAPVSSTSSRDKKAILHELIDYCRIWRKGAEMARHVGKTQKYIVRHLIPEMIECGLLIREYPDNPHHPAQRYRTKPKSGSNKDS